MPEPCTLETRIGNYYYSGHRGYSVGKGIQAFFFVSASSAVFMTGLSSLTGKRASIAEQAAAEHIMLLRWIPTPVNGDDTKR